MKTAQPKRPYMCLAAVLVMLYTPMAFAETFLITEGAMGGSRVFSDLPVPFSLSGENISLALRLPSLYEQFQETAFLGGTVFMGANIGINYDIPEVVPPGFPAVYTNATVNGVLYAYPDYLITGGLNFSGLANLPLGPDGQYIVTAPVTFSGHIEVGNSLLDPISLYGSAIAHASYMCFDGRCNVNSWGFTFTNPIPEPNTGTLMIIPALWLMAGRIRRRMRLL